MCRDPGDISDVLPLKKCQDISEDHSLNTYIQKIEQKIHATIYKIDKGALNQDGRGEGHALTPSCKNTRITTNC